MSNQSKNIFSLTLPEAATKMSESALSNALNAQIERDRILYDTKKLESDAQLKKEELDIEKQKNENDKQKAERGYLGKFFGSKENSIYSSTCLFLILCFIATVFYTVYMVYKDPKTTHSQVIEFWKITSPLMTLAFGYLFGANKQ